VAEASVAAGASGADMTLLAPGSFQVPSTPKVGTASHPVITLIDVVKRYPMGGVEVFALRGVTLVVERGDYVAIMGASGSGKSTLMNIIGCLDVPTRGHYLLDGVNVRHLEEQDLSRIRNRKIGFVFQSFNLLPRMKALANVELPLTYAGVPPKQRKARAMAALERVGLAERVDHFPTELSGGQQQRVAVARAIATNPSLVLADEPTGNLDTSDSKDVLDMIGRLHADGGTVVLITHENDVAKRANRIVRLRDGQIIEDRRTDTPEVSGDGVSGDGAAVWVPGTGQATP
jgi:putative ABC transport system ATP-binding protein